MCGWDDEFLLFLWEVSWKNKNGDVDESRTKMEEWTGKLQKKLRRVLDSVYVFLTLLLVSQLHYEKRIQKFVLRNEEELTEFTKTTWQWNKGKTTYV